MNDRNAWLMNDVGYCGETGKVMYTRRELAKRTARSMSRPRPSAYRCDHCNYWHLGHNGEFTRAEHRMIHEEVAA